MNKQQLIIDRIYNKYRDSIFDSIHAKHSKQLLEFQQTEWSKEARQQDTKFNQWMFKDNIDNKLFYCVQNGQVVGQSSAIAIDLNLGDICVKGAYAVDLKIAQEWKMKGLGVAMLGAQMEEFDVLIALGGTEDARKMILRQGWHELGRLSFFVKPINTRGAKSNSRNNPARESFRNLAALVLSRFVDSYQNIMTQNITLVPNSEFGQQHQIFLEEFQMNVVNSANKNIHFLNWRYRDFPGQTCYEIYNYYTNSGKLEGFTVVKESLRNGKKTLKVVELMAKTNLISPFISELVKIAHNKKMDIILFHFLNPVLKEKLKKHAFFQPINDRKFFVFSKNDELYMKIDEVKNWQVSFGESDMDFSLD